MLATNKPDPKIDESAEPNPPSTIETPMEEDTLPDDLNPDLALSSQLLALRQKFKKTSSNLMKMKSHLEFINTCKEKAKVPKGLRIKTQCNALLADFTNVGHRFEDIKHRAEREFAEALIEHYELTTEKLEFEKSILVASMNRACRDCTDKQTVENHQTLLKKTEDNLAKHQTALEEKKLKKLEALDEPQPKKPRPNGPRTRRQRRGGMNKTNPNPSSLPNKFRHLKITSSGPRNNNSLYINPNCTNSQVTALLSELLQHRQALCQPQVPQMGFPQNAFALQQPSLWGTSASLGQQQPSLSGLGINGLLPQQPQLQGVGQDFLLQGRHL